MDLNVELSEVNLNLHYHYENRDQTQVCLFEYLFES